LLWTGMSKVKKQIRKMLKSLKAFETDAAIDRSEFVAISDLFLTNNVLKHQWREFEECVVIDRLSDGTEQYRNTVAANDFFNFEDVVNTANSWTFDIKFNFFNVVPNLLTGLGILGTFIGIINGLQADPNVATASVGGIDINTFIGGLRGSFGTSICGLFLATFFTLVEKLKMDRCEHIVNELSQEIDRLFKRKVEQEYLLNISNALEEQNSTLKTLAAEIGGEVIKGITGMGIDTVDIGDNVKEGISQGFTRLGENLGEINDLHKTYQDSAKIIIEESKNVGIAVTYLNKAVQGYSGNLNDTSAKFVSASEKLEALNVQQTKQIESFGSTTENIIKAAELSNGSIDKLVSTKEEFQTAFSKTSSDLEQMVSSFSTLVDEYNSKTQGALTNTFTAIDTEMSKAVTSLGKGIGEMSEGVDNMGHYLGQLKSFVDKALVEIENTKKSESGDVPPPLTNNE